MDVRVVFVAFALMACVPSKGVARAGESTPAAEDAVDRGLAKYKSGDLDGAIAEYTRAIQISPRFSFAHLERGKIKEEKGDIDGAFADYTRAIELNPRFADPYFGRGGLKQARGDLDGAIADYTRAIEIIPRFAAAYSNRGGVNWVKGDLDGAIADYTRAIELDPRHAAAYVGRGGVKGAKGDPAGAIADCSKAIEIDPKYVRAYAERGRARVDGGDLAGALSDFDRVLELGSRSAAAYGNRAGVRWKLGDLDGALADYDRAIELAPDSAVAFNNRGYVRERMGSFAAALSDFARAIAIDPRFLRSYAHRGETRICLREFGAAADDLRKALELDSTYDSARLFLFVAQGLGTDGEAGARAALAASLAVRATPLDRGSWTAHLCEFLGGRSSVEALLEAADALPEDQRAHARCSAWFYAGMVAWIRGRQASAVELLERCAAANSTKGAEPAVARAVLAWPRAPVSAPLPSADGIPDRTGGALRAPEGEADAGPAHLDAGRGLLIVCGDAELVSDDFSGGRKDVTKGVTRVWGGTAGFPFIGNLVGWMTGGDDVRSILANGSQTPDPVTVPDPIKRVLAGLPSPARISVYWGGVYPRRAQPAYVRLRRLLGAFAASSGAKLEIVWVKMDEAGKEEASRLGIHQDTFQVSSPEKTITCFDGLSISYGTRRENVGGLIESGDGGQTLRLSSTVEYDVAAALDRLSRTRKAVVGLVRAPSPPASTAPRGETEDRFSTLAKSVLAKAYGDDFRDAVDLRSSVPGDVTVLVVAAPREWSAAQTYHLEQFLLRGGRVLLLLDPIDVRAARGAQPTARSGLDEWLAAVGVKVAPGVVGDLDEAHMGSALAADGKMTAYPFFVQALRAELSQEHPATCAFASVPFYFPAELSVDAKTQVAAGRTATVLATTSASGFVRKEATGLGDWSRAGADPGELAKRTLLVQLDGPFTSFWKGKPKPDDRSPSPPAVPVQVPVESAAAKAFLAGWAAREGNESDAATGYPKRIRRTKDGAEMVLIPPGEFPMGAVRGDTRAQIDEGPHRVVTITRAYYLDVNEVTNEQFGRFVAATSYRTSTEKESSGSALNDDGTVWEATKGLTWRTPLAGGGSRPDLDRHPVVFVSAQDATAYAAWAGAALPTEAQFERALREGKDPTTYPWGDTLPAPKGFSNCCADEFKRAYPSTKFPIMSGYDDGYVRTAPVRSFRPNRYGACDLAGNVWEWCADWYAPQSYAMSPDLDPAGPASGTTRVARGGSWFDGDFGLRACSRYYGVPTICSDSLGFRCARSLPAGHPGSISPSHAPPSAEAVRGSWDREASCAKFGENVVLEGMRVDVPIEGPWSAGVRMDFTILESGAKHPMRLDAAYTNGRVEGEFVRFDRAPWKRTAEAQPALKDLEGFALTLHVTRDGTLVGAFEGDEGWWFTIAGRAVAPAAPSGPAAPPSPATPSSPSTPAAPAASAGAPAAERTFFERVCDLYVEARTAHLLTEQRANRLLRVTPFDSLGRTWADYQAGVAFLESRSVVPASLGDAARALPDASATTDWGRFVLDRTRTDLAHAEEDRVGAMKFFDEHPGFGAPRGGQESRVRMAARVHALFGADPFGPPRRAVEARMGPATGKPRTTFADPAYAVYLRAQARIAGRIVAAFAKDTDRMVAGASGASVAELRFVLDPNTSSFQNVGQLVLFDLEANLKGAPLLEGADRARADEARRELESAATLASNARAAFDALRPRIEALDRKIKADAAAEDDDDPDTLMPDFLHWSRDLGYVEKRCREVAAALASKLAPGR